MVPLITMVYAVRRSECVWASAMTAARFIDPPLWLYWLNLWLELVLWFVCCDGVP
jgi:hypothetical protein